MSHAPLYLLDTNICIHLLKGTPPEVTEALLNSGGYRHAVTSILTVFEMRFGAEKSTKAGEVHRALDAFFTILPVRDFDAKAAEHAAQIRHELKRQPIGPYDLLIAGHARSLGAVLVTRNEKEFKRVPGLKVVAW